MLTSQNPYPVSHDLIFRIVESSAFFFFNVSYHLTMRITIVRFTFTFPVS